PLPMLLPFRELADLLSIEALERNDGSSERVTTAVRRLTAGLHERPQMISCLISAALDGQALALSRRLSERRAAIGPELATYDYLTAFWRSWQSEAYYMWHYAR